MLGGHERQYALGTCGLGQRGVGRHVIVLRELRAEDWRTWRSMRRAALADAPEAFGSTLAEWSGAGDTEERWRARLVAVPYNVLAELDGSPVGMVSATSPAHGDMELLSMWVAPEGRGRGVGDALVTWVRERARQAGATRVLLDVRAANSHAITLYERNGFCDIGAASEPGDPRPERRMAAALHPDVAHAALPDP